MKFRPSEPVSLGQKPPPYDPVTTRYLVADALGGNEPAQFPRHRDGEVANREERQGILHIRGHTETKRKRPQMMSKAILSCSGRPVTGPRTLLFTLRRRPAAPGYSSARFNPLRQAMPINSSQPKPRLRTIANRLVIRDGWLRKFHHRRQMADDGRIKCNTLGILGKWRCPCRRSAWQVRTR